MTDFVLTSSTNAKYKLVSLKPLVVEGPSMMVDFVLRQGILQSDDRPPVAKLPENNKT